MRKELKIYDCLCATKQFTINGVAADEDDFGTQGDDAPDEAEPYGCGDMHFTPKPATDAILKKYKISTDEYTAIASELEAKLSFGSCGWCV